MKNSQHTVFKFPFHINANYFLVAAILFYFLSLKPIQDIVKSNSKRNITSTIENDLKNRIEQAKLLTTNNAILNKVIQKTLTNTDLTQLDNLPFHFFIFKNHELVFWNTNKINPVANNNQYDEIKPIQLNNGYYVYFNTRYDNQHIIQFLLPVKYDYGFNNTIISNHFYALAESKKCDFDLSIPKNPNSFSSIKYKDVPLFYLFEKKKEASLFNTSPWDLFKASIFFILFGICIHTYLKIIIKYKNHYNIFFSLIFTTIIIRSITYIFSFPNSFYEYSLFNPKLFYYNSINKSIGDVFINASLILWIVEFYLLNVQDSFTISKFKKWLFLIPSVGTFILFLVALHFKSIIFKITNSSALRFDSSIIQNFDYHIFMAITICLLLFIIFTFLLIINNKSYTKYAPNVRNKYLTVILCSILVFFFKGSITTFHYFITTFWILLFIILIDKQTKALKLDFNSYRLLIWLVFISLSCTLLLSYYIYIKDKQLQKNFADKLVEQRDFELEKEIQKIDTKILTDTFIQSCFVMKHDSARKLLYDYIFENYFNAINIKHQMYVHLYGFEPKSKILSDTTNFSLYNSLFNQTSNKLNRHIGLNISNDFRFQYIIKYEIIANSKIVGEIFVRILKNSVVSKYKYYNLLKAQQYVTSIENSNYSYAIYKDSIQVSETGNYKFNRNLNFYNQQDFNHASIAVSEKNNYIALVHNNFTLINLASALFALLFLIIFISLSLYIFGNILVRSNLNYYRFLKLLNVNFRFRIHFTIILIELFSFLVIWIIVSKFFIAKLDDNRKEVLLLNAKYATAYIRGQNNDNNDLFNSNNPIPNSTLQQYILKIISDRIDAEVSIFNTQGELINTSQKDPYRNGFLNNYLNPAFYFSNSNRELNYIFINQKIGTLNYYSVLNPLINKFEKIIGYVQISFFDVLKYTETEKTKILINLINIFILIFSIASIIAYYITDYITRSFSKVVKQFTKINLNKTNELLKWPYSDEIGVLVMEYNRMLRKLENSTLELAKNERDLAWREMAKQVAHEIKNPLTPMKLSLQMLQRAIQRNAPNVLELSSRFANTMIEQIEVLNVIATDFSNFAKLPEMNFSQLDICDLLKTSLGMYYNTERVELNYNIINYPVYVNVDRIQIQRVITNILENAIQAVHTKKDGIINVTTTQNKSNQTITISFHDNGVGIPNEIKDKIFNPNFTTKSSGSGLGLAMCKDIIEKCKGKIWFETIPNQETTFFIELPVIKMDDDLHFSIS